MAAARRPGFVEEVRQELVRLPIADADALRAELAAIVRFAGTLTYAGRRAASGRPGIGLEVVTRSGAVARRVFSLLERYPGIRPDLAVRAPGGMRSSSTYHVGLGPASTPVARRLGVIDADGRPVDGVAEEIVRSSPDAWLRGAVLAAASFSRPGRPPHLEFGVTSLPAARTLAETLSQVAGSGARVLDGTRRGSRTRVVVKSGEVIGALLVRVGATQAFLHWDERRLRRQLRGEANRLANADSANLRRSVETAARQVEQVEAVVAAVGWDGISDDLRGLALARLANPTVSLKELGELLDPPISKAAVHRRLQRLTAPSGRDEATTTPERRW